MNLSILFEDDFFIVIDKPTGVVVNRANSVKEITISEWAEEKLKINPPAGGDNLNSEHIEFQSRSGIVHRLDKETSGLLIIAKTPLAFSNLQSQFKSRTVIKKYISLVHGKIISNGVIAAPVGRLPWNRERFGVLVGGREAETSYELINWYKNSAKETFSLVNVIPHTGRTHQIRIHFKYIGHTIVADKFYNGTKVYQKDREFCPRLFLHAYFIKVRHPENGKLLEFNSQLPSDLSEVLNNLEKTLKQ